jgi:hypothetical protein
MKTKILMILGLVVALFALNRVAAQPLYAAQDTNLPPEFVAALADTNPPPVGHEVTSAAPTVAGGLSEIWTALTANSTNGLSGQTNWALIPYAAYDLETKKYGGGAAVLYAVAPNFWAGVRAQDLGGRQTTASVQGQLQVTKKIFGLTVTSFLETSVGLGKDALYGSAGPGGLISFHTWAWSGKSLTLGVVGDYEHYVQGDASGNQINAGLLIRFSF